MKVFISVDIEGICAATTYWEELLPPKPEHVKQMTAEVVAACEGAIAAGATEILIKDAHNDGHNLDIFQFPEEASIFRGFSGHPYGQMQGITSKFDAAILIGQHAAATRGGNPLSHTSVRRIYHVKINGRIASEFMIAAWTALYEKVPTLFVSGDKMLCEDDSDLHPNLITCPVKEGIGAATLLTNPKVALKAIKKGVEKALSQKDIAPLPKLPPAFELEVRYKDPIQAERYAYYPGVKKIDYNTLVFKTDDYFEMLTAYSFMK